MEVIRFTRGGGVRKLFASPDRTTFEALPRRATRVEVVAVGPRRGEFYVDFSPLGPEYRFCLVQTFVDYAAAVAAEQAWLVEHWICG